jgi:Lamin Tail Domain/Fn3 associated/CotH kinase protein/Chitobiase/beta-hexosaminidase C-terminal domain
MFLPALAAALLPATVSPTAPHGDLQISEFLAVNSGGLLDEDGASSDWIEIANRGLVSVDLSGWHLTDDALAPTKWTFPTLVLVPGQRVVVFASDKDRALAGSELHTNFKLSSGGEYLALIDPGLAVSSAYAPAFPVQTPNVAYGLRDSMPDEGYFAPPTPGAPNGDVFAALAPINVSEPRGLKSAAFQLALSHPEPGSVIRYTLDGSHPAAGQVYAGPLAVAGTTLVRAQASKTGNQPSPVATQSYLFPAEVLTQSDAYATSRGFHPQWIEDDGTDWTLGGTRPGAWYGFDQGVLGLYSQQELLDVLGSLPTISLVMHEQDWFGDGSIGETAGIYCNSVDSGAAWDRPGSAEWLDPAGGPEFQVDCGIAIQGGTSTGQNTRNQLSIALKFKSEFGPTKLQFAPFEDAGLDEYDYLVLDAGNQLSPNGKGGANQKIHAQGLRDQFMSDLHLAMGELSPAGTYVHLYLNGLYWGVYNLHERIDHRTAAAYQGGAPEEYDWVREGTIRSGNSNPWNDPLPGRWSTAVEIAKGGLKPGDTWQGGPSYDAFKKIFDVSDYSDYLLLNYYGGNTDWPQNNWMGTIHARKSADFADVNPFGRWRWHSWDAETVLYWGGSELVVGDGFWDRTSVTSTWEGAIAFFYTYLRDNPDWRMLMADRAHQHLFHGAFYVDPAYSAAGTPYDPAFPERNRPATLYYRLAALTEPAIALEYARWGNYWNAPGLYTPADWLIEKQRLLDEYFPVRSGVLLAQLRNVQPQLYPNLDAPVMSPYGGALKKTDLVTLTVPPNSTVYYTFNGQDPRQDGGSINPAAKVYSGPFTLAQANPTATVRARAFDGNEWSAMELAGFAVGVKVRLNELVARNQTGLLDEMGQTEDWVELVNTGQQPFDLGGWGLSDDLARPGRWRIPAGTTIPAKSRLIIYLDNDLLDGPLHASFKLSSSGEAVVLSGPSADGHVIVDAVEFGPQRPDVALARIPDSSGPWRATPTPTPGAVNRLRERGVQ